jgi:hypothetical protein
MGGSVSKMMGKIFGTKEMRILMLGLDAAGKTSMITMVVCVLSGLKLIVASYSLQIETQQPGRDHDPHRRIQRRERDL